MGNWTSYLPVWLLFLNKSGYRLPPETPDSANSNLTTMSPWRASMRREGKARGLSILPISLPQEKMPPGDVPFPEKSHHTRTHARTHASTQNAHVHRKSWDFPY